LIGIIAVLVLVALWVNKRTPVSEFLFGVSESNPDGCRIKGNINLQGERIYHVPDGEWYDKTLVDITEGERWFCSEKEARLAGWRRSYE
jgi:hypothetical protein